MTLGKPKKIYIVLFRPINESERRNMATILRLPQVKARTGLSRTSIYLRVKAGTFPAPISLGDRAVGWLDSNIDGWIAERPTTGTVPAPAQAIAARRKARTAMAPAA